MAFWNSELPWNWSSTNWRAHGAKQTRGVSDTPHNLLGAGVGREGGWSLLYLLARLVQLEQGLDKLALVGVLLACACHVSFAGPYNGQAWQKETHNM